MKSYIRSSAYYSIPIFLSIFCYYQKTRTLKINPTFYESSINTILKKFLFKHEMPLPTLAMGNYIHAVRLIFEKFGLDDEFLLSAFNLLAALTLTVNVVLTLETFSVFGALVFYTSSFFVNRMTVLGNEIVQFTCFNLANFILFRIVKRADVERVLFGGVVVGLLISADILGGITLIICLAVYMFYLAMTQACNPKMSLSVAAKSLTSLFFFVIIALGVCTSLFHIFFTNQTGFTSDAKHFSLEFQSTLDNVAEPCDRYLLDRALVTFLSRETKSFLSFNEAIASGSETKTTNGIWRILKIHVESSPDFNPEIEENNFIKQLDYLKIVHYATGKFLVAKSDIEAKFIDLELTEKDGDDTFWQIISKDPVIETRRSLFRLKHVTTGKELCVRGDAKSVAISIDSRPKLRWFYVEDAQNEVYYKKEYKDPRANQKIVKFPQIGFTKKMIEYVKLVLHSKTKKSFGWTGTSTEIEECSFLWHIILVFYVLMPAILVVNDILQVRLNKRLIKFDRAFFVLLALWIPSGAMSFFYEYEIIYFFYLSIFMICKFGSLITNQITMLTFFGAIMSIQPAHREFIYEFLVKLRGG